MLLKTAAGTALLIAHLKISIAPSSVTVLRVISRFTTSPVLGFHCSQHQIPVILPCVSTISHSSVKPRGRTRVFRQYSGMLISSIVNVFPFPHNESSQNEHSTHAVRSTVRIIRCNHHLPGTRHHVACCCIGGGCEPRIHAVDVGAIGCHCHPCENGIVFAAHRVLAFDSECN